MKKEVQTISEVDSPESIASAPSVSQSRRRLIQAGLSAAPVMLAVSGRSAMAGGTSTPTCLSPMAWYSANPHTGTVRNSLSVHSTGTPGCTPKKWKPCDATTTTTVTFPTTNVPRWPTSCKPFDKIEKQGYSTQISWKASNCSTYAGLNHKITKSGSNVPVDPGWSTGTCLTWLDSRSCSNLLIDEADADSLKAHVCAAYLNACIAEESNKPFPLSSADVQTCYTTKKLGGHDVTDADLLAFFKQTCA
jgi:hypothetical protein